MRIVYICDFFHPDAGYHPNLLSKYWSKFGHEVYMLTSELERMPTSLTKFFDCEGIDKKDRHFEEEYGVKIVRCPIYRFVSGRSVYRNYIFSQLEIIDPDVVYVNGNDTLIGMQLTVLYKKHKYGLVMDSHMLEIASTNSRLKLLFRSVYKRVIAPIILKNNIPVIRAQNSDYVEKYLGLPLSRCPWISFGSDLLLFHRSDTEKEIKRKELGISNEAFVIIYAGKVNNTKGVDLLAEAIKDKFVSSREVCFVIVGSTEGSEGEAIETYLKDSENRIIRVQTQRYTDLPGFYQMADIAVFPKQCSLSFFDVQACGLPVVFENNDINIERSQANNAKVFMAENAKDLRSQIEYFLNMDKSEFDQYRDNSVSYVKKHYNYEDRARDYIPYLLSQAKAKGRI